VWIPLTGDIAHQLSRLPRKPLISVSKRSTRLQDNTDFINLRFRFLGNRYSFLLDAHHRPIRRRCRTELNQVTLYRIVSQHYQTPSRMYAYVCPKTRAEQGTVYLRSYFFSQVSSRDYPVYYVWLGLIYLSFHFLSDKLLYRIEKENARFLDVEICGDARYV
jgi:hypothetical protein